MSVNWGHRSGALVTCAAAFTAGITGVGSCWGITTQGSSNTVIADNVVNDIAVYGWDQTVLYKSGEPAVVYRGRELGMTNRIDRVPA